MIDFDTAVFAWRARLREEDYSPRTIEEYAYVIERMQQTLPLLSVPAVVEPLLREYRAGLQERLNSGSISRSLVIVAVAALRSFYRVLIDLEHYPEDPTTKLRSAGAAKGVPRPLTAEQVNRLFAAVPKDTIEGLRDRCLLWLYYHSLRNSEAGALTLNNVIYSAAEDSFVLRFKAKGAKTRVVVLIEPAARDLATFCLNRYKFLTPVGAEFTPQEVLAAEIAKAPRGTQWGAIFLTNGRPITRREANRMFAKYRDKANIGPSGPHSLRHTCATNLLNAGVDIRVVQTILGHASIRQTEAYTEVMTDTKGQAMSKLAVPNG